MSDWQSDLDAFFGKKEETQQEQESKLDAIKALVAPFIEGVALPAFEEAKTALEGHGRRVEIGSHSGPGNAYVSMRVYCGETKELDYTLEVRVNAFRALPVPVTRASDRSAGRTYRSEGYMRSGSQDYGVSDLTQEDVRRHLLGAYKQSEHVVGKSG